jgi:hypothetical protein
VQLRFTGEIVHWRGPAPYYFVAVPPAECRQLRDAAPEVSYGWGVIPVRGRLGATEFTTSLFPKDGGYLVPLKVAVRRAEDVDDGDVVALELMVEE